MYVKRTAENMILELSRSFPCIVVYGPRQVGKSTTIDFLFGSDCRKVTMDDLEDRALAVMQPRLFLETYGWPLIIDEIQKAPALLSEIKKQIDDQRLTWLKTGKPRRLMYILTGSSRFELQQGISESLAGRCGVIDLPSFSLAEKSGVEPILFRPDLPTLLDRERTMKFPIRTRREIIEMIFQGGMPDICTGVSERDAYLKSYVDTYIEKDVKKLVAAGNELQFRTFISILALRTAQELRYEEIAGNAGIDVRTCKRWLSILETSGIIFLLQPYLANLSKRIIKSPKLYFMDTGLCAHLCKWPTSEMIENGAMSGAFFETFVVSEIVKNFFAFNHDPKETLFFYRDVDQKEIDLIYVENDRITPIEIKKGIAPKKPAKNFNVLEKTGRPIQTGLIIENTDKIRPVQENVFAYPVSYIGM